MPSTHQRPAAIVHLIVPVKPLTRAKSRLRGASTDHQALVLAMLLDTLAAAEATPAVDRITVVSSDPVVTAELTGRTVELAEDPGELNAALRHGARLASRHGTVAALQADLPALRPADLAAALAEAAGRRAFCADLAGTGTTLLIAAPGEDLTPRFGAGSAVAHRAGGAIAITAEVPTLRCDVDTHADLDTAVALGVGRHTAAVLARGNVHPTASPGHAPSGRAYWTMNDREHRDQPTGRRTGDDNRPGRRHERRH